MSANRVLTAKLIKQVTNSGGRLINVKYATETQAWKRTQLAPENQHAFVAAVEKADVPAGATTAVMVETEHPSQKDSYSHWTTAWQDDNGKHVTTKHLYP